MMYEYPIMSGFYKGQTLHCGQQYNRVVWSGDFEIGVTYQFVLWGGKAWACFDENIVLHRESTDSWLRFILKVPIHHEKKMIRDFQLKYITEWLHYQSLDNWRWVR